MTSLPSAELQIVDFSAAAKMRIISQRTTTPFPASGTLFQKRFVRTSGGTPEWINWIKTSGAVPSPPTGNLFSTATGYCSRSLWSAET